MKSRTPNFRWGLLAATCPSKRTVQIPSLIFCRSDGCRVSASNLTAKTCPPIELLPMALDRRHASFQIDGPDYFGISPWLFPMVNLAQLLSDLTVLVLSGNLDGIQRSPSSFFSVNFYCARFLQCACFLQCCSSCAFTSKSPNSAYPAISVVAIKDNHHQHTFVACSIFANIQGKCGFIHLLGLVIF
jgi:hypothetical protein